MGIDMVGSSSFRKLEAAKLSDDGKISKKDAEELGEAVGGDKELAKQVLAQDTFDDGAKEAFVKAAKLGRFDLPKNAIAGKMVGGASVLRTLGDPKGYQNPMQAVASARMSGVKNAAVVQQGGRFFPVELSKSAPGAQTTGDKNIQPAFGLTPRDDAAIQTARDNLATAKANGADGAKLGQLRRELASKTFGLPPESFNVIAREEDRVATTLTKDGGPTGINIMVGMFEKTNGALGTHGAVGSKGDGFDPANPTAITLDAGDLEGRVRFRDSMENGKPKHEEISEPPDTDQALGVLEHEATHLEDTVEAKDLISKWGGNFKDNPAGFTKWLGEQAKGPNITYAEMSRVLQTVSQGAGDTELHAHMATAVDAIRNGSPEVAKEQMRDYAVSVKKTAAANPQASNHVLAEAARAFKSMNKDQKAQFLAALKEAGPAFKNFNPATFNLAQDM